MILKRLKNLWKLSAYEPATRFEYTPTGKGIDVKRTPILKKTVTTVEAKPATIIDLEAKDPFEEIV